MGDFQRVQIEPVIPGAEKPEVVGAKPAAQAVPSESKPVAPVKPEWVPEKFWKDGAVDQEGLAKSYTELEKKAWKPAEASKPDEKKADEKPAGEQPPAVVVPGVTAESQQKYTKELQEGGTLSETSYEELAKAGYPKGVVDAYLKGMQGQAAEGSAQATLAAARTVELKAIAGGEEGYGAMIGWASNTLTPAEVAAYDTVMASNDPAQIELAVRGLHAKYTTAVGQEPDLIGGRTAGASNGDVFTSMSEVQTAMRDKRYKSDPAYRKSVEDKVGRSAI